MAWYHGGSHTLNFNSVSGSHSVGTGLWLTDNFQTAVTYMRDDSTKEKSNPPCVVELEVQNLNKTLTIDFKGGWWSKMPELPADFKDCKITDDIVRKAKKLGYDSVKFTNVRDMKGASMPYTRGKFTVEEAFKPSTTLVITSRNQIKSTKTYESDDIPLLKESYFNY